MMTPGSRQERWILRAGVLVLIVLIWEGLCRVGLASEFWVSRPFLIAARLRDAALSSSLWFHMGVTVTETVFGFLFGAMAGILAGFALARWRRAHVALDPYLMGVYALPRVALVIERLTGVRYHPGHVWYILRRLGWSLQRPTRQARERDEAAILQWKRARWPQVKKTRDAGGRGSSSKTKAASRTGRSFAARGPRAATPRS